jgi:MFS family permease
MRAKTIYYGWANLAIAALAMVATLPGRTQGFGLITEPLIADLHIDRVTYATINLWATLIGAAFCLPCGRLLDRYGSRIVLTLTVLFLGATVATMRAMEGIAALSIGITLTRGFGQSALSVVSLALIGKWFARRLNLAMGVYALLVGIGFIAAFPSVGAAVVHYGWRPTWGSIGWVLLLIVAPLSWLIVRNQPEDRGLELDGVSEPAPKLTDLTTSEALRSPAFWIFALSSSLFGLVYSGISLFNESILVERGFNASVYHDVLVISTMLGLLANFGGGWLATKMPIQRLSGIGMAALAVALVILPMVRTYTHVLIYGAIMGIAGGVVTVVFFSVWGQVFGRSHLGRIQGCAQMMTVLASALGPLLLAETLKSTGSYDFMFNLLAVLTVVLGVAAWFVRMPSREPSAAPAAGFPLSAST